MPGASFFSILATALLVTRDVVALDYALYAFDPTVTFLPDVPLSSDICSVDFTANEDCTGEWFNFDDTAPANLTTVYTWGSGSSVTVEFYGTGITFLGRTGPDGASFYAAVDDLEFLQVDTVNKEYEFEVPLFEQLGLPMARHVLQMYYDDTTFSADEDARRFFGVDYWIVSGAPEDGTVTESETLVALAIDETTGTAAPPTNNGTSSDSGRGAATGGDADLEEALAAEKATLGPAGVGALVGVIFLTLILTAVTVFIFLRRRRRMREASLAAAKSYPFAQESLAVQEANVGMQQVDLGMPKASGGRPYSMTPPQRPQGLQPSPLYTSPQTRAF